MIKNERQYRITKAQAQKFASALNDAQAKTDIDPLLAELEQNAIRSQLDELAQQIDEYEELQAGSRSVIDVDSFGELPNALVKARIAAGLSQKDLAERLEMKEQQIQRYESTDYRTASLARLQEVVHALGISVREEVFLPTRSATAPALFKRLASAGVERQFVLDRLLPPSIADRMACVAPEPSEVEVRQAATTIGRVFDWDIEDMFGGEPLTVPRDPAGLARFKLPSRSDERKLSAYTVYAHYLALLVLEATSGLDQYEIPVDADEFRGGVLSEYGSLTFSNVLSFIWRLGIPVLPLNDSGAFHGACWRVESRNVIVLKQRTNSLARWTHDCLHEAYHAGQEPDAKERTVIEEPENSEDRRDDIEEQEANTFAGDVMLDGRAEELVQMCVNAAGGQVQRLKSVVPKIAASEDVEVGALANYLGYRLALQGINWWGAAANLQKDDANPWEITRDQLLSQLDLDRLNEADRQILTQALTKQKD